tara:strand:- start:1693 stop:2775 length:1083 start_codon:yes stop_codon:yes gene_type:complete
MKFFNLKEEVIDIELTSYGKHLLSKGKFKPHYYAFFDDGVLYDAEYGGTNEPQKDAQNRIKNDTPRLKAQSCYTSAKTNLDRDLEPIRSQQIDYELRQDLIPSVDMIQRDADKFYSLKYAIGTSDLNTNKAPAWNVKFLRGFISSSSDFLTGAFSSLSIPQIETSQIKYEAVVGKATIDADLGDVQYINGEDGSYIDIIEKNGELILDISENNVFFGEGNFDIEVYSVEYQTLSTGEQQPIMTPLYFTKEESLVENNILKDIPEDEILDEYPTRGFLNDSDDLGQIRTLKLDPSYVEYFFAIDVDKEIGDELLCELTQDKTSGIFGERFVECEKAEKKDSFDTSKVFDTDVQEGDIIDCE